MRGFGRLDGVMRARVERLAILKKGAQVIHRLRMANDGAQIALCHHKTAASGDHHLRVLIDDGFEAPHFKLPVRIFAVQREDLRQLHGGRAFDFA